MDYSKFKTQLCVHHTANEECRFGDTCHYAHGEGELQGKPPRPATNADLAKMYIKVLELQEQIAGLHETLATVVKVVNEQAPAVGPVVDLITEEWAIGLFPNDPEPTVDEQEDADPSTWWSVKGTPFNKLKDVKHPEQTCTHCSKLLVDKNKQALYSHQFRCKSKPATKKEKTPKKEKK